MAIEHKISVFPYSGKPTLFFTLNEGERIHVQYAIRPPKWMPNENEFRLDEETSQLKRLAGPKGSGRKLMEFVHDVFQDYATHHQKNIRVRLSVTNEKVADCLSERGYTFCAQNGATKEMEGIIRPKPTPLDEGHRKRMNDLLAQIEKCG
ncbi:MAG: hypothetical protein Q8P02_05640 [Candidatus Micrarchaeota archaeon]|nr:hypothetical protein [Candidatus Micrarchaeota archaeon]